MKNTDIVSRNFFKLMRSGAMNEYIQLEPMSAFKWTKLIDIAVEQDVASVAARAIRNQQYEKSFNMPEPLREKVITLAKQSQKHTLDISLDNPLLNRKLSRIYNAEKNSENYSEETLTLFNIIIANCNAILNHGTSTRLVIRLGNYMRVCANKIDYTKINQWIASVQMRRVAQLVGSILICNFAFKEEEVPFVRKKDPKAATLMMQNITRQKAKKHTRGITYFEYAPLENASILFSQLKGRLDDIEE